MCASSGGGVLDGTDLSPRLYIISRVCHFFLAAIFLIWAAPTIPTSNFPLPTPSLPGTGTLWLGAMGILLGLTILSLWHQRHQACLTPHILTAFSHNS